MNRKGDISGGIVLIIIVFFLAISFIVVAFANDKIKNIIEDTPLNQSEAADNIITSIDYLTTTSINRAFIFLFSFLIIGMMLSSFLVRVHTAWIFLYVLFLVFSVIIAVPLANTYQAVIEASALSGIAAQQTAITFVMQHSVKILIGATLLSWIILFAKPQGGERI